jgi:hypothetical protein
MRVMLLLAAGACLAQMTSPRIGYVRDVRGDVRPVYGVSGAFVLGEPIEDAVVAASFSGVAGLVKKDRSLLVYRQGERVATLDAPAGNASFGFDASGKPKWVRFADASCVVWRNDVVPEAGACPTMETPAVEDVPGVVQSVDGLGEGWLAVRTDSGLWAVRTGLDRRVYRLPEAEQ